jgi:hypothetical protein
LLPEVSQATPLTVLLANPWLLPYFCQLVPVYFATPPPFVPNHLTLLESMPALKILLLPICGVLEVLYVVQVSAAEMPAITKVNTSTVVKNLQFFMFFPFASQFFYFRFDKTIKSYAKYTSFGITDDLPFPRLL